MYFFGGYTKVTEEMFDSLRWRASLFCNRVREMCNWCPSNLGCCCVWELITSSGALPPILKVAPKRKVMSEFLDRLLIHNILVFRRSFRFRDMTLNSIRCIVERGVVGSHTGLFSKPHQSSTAHPSAGCCCQWPPQVNPRPPSDSTIGIACRHSSQSTTDTRYMRSRFSIPFSIAVLKYVLINFVKLFRFFETFFYFFLFF